MMLVKLLPLLVVVAGFAIAVPGLRGVTHKAMALPEVLVAQQAAFELARSAQAQPQNATEKTRLISSGPFSKDPWDQPFRIRYLRKRHELVVTSNGPDGQPDTADDVRARFPIERPTSP